MYLLFIICFYMFELFSNVDVFDLYLTSFLTFPSCDQLFVVLTFIFLTSFFVRVLIYLFF